MKKIIIITNYSVSNHATRFLKHHKNPVDIFHVDVKDYGINPSDNVLDHLNLDLVHMVLCKNPLTAFKLYTKYPNDVAFCLMDDDCDYSEIAEPTIYSIIEMTCGFKMPPEINTKYEQEVNEFVKNLSDTNILVVSDLYKVIHSTDKNVKVAFWNIHEPKQLSVLAKELKNIEHVIIKDVFFKDYDQLINITNSIDAAFKETSEYKTYMYSVNEDDSMLIWQ